LVTAAAGTRARSERRRGCRFHLASVRSLELCAVARGDDGLTRRDCGGAIDETGVDGRRRRRSTARRGRLARLDFNLSFVTSTVVSAGNVASGVSSVNVHGITVRLLVVVNADSRPSLRRSDFLLELERALTLRALLL
jgi:hypothetical protein